MDSEQALAFVREHGVVLVAASGPVPKLTEAIGGADALAALGPWAKPGPRLLPIVTSALKQAD